MKRHKQFFQRLGAAAFWLAVWQCAAMAVGQEVFLVSPVQAVRTLLQLLPQAEFWQRVGFSSGRILLGFGLGVAVSIVLAVAAQAWHTADVLLAPVLQLVKATPVASFIILALVWIRTNTLPAFIAFLMVVPVVWGNVEKGIRETDAGLLEMAKVYRLGWWKTLVRVRIPSVMPYFLAAATTGLGFAWKSGIAAEVICRPAMSIGRQLQDAKVYLETPEVFAWTAVVVALSMVLEKGLLLAVRRLKRYNTGGEGDGA